MKMFVTFGQIHKHEIAGVTFDKDVVAVVSCGSVDHGMTVIQNTLGGKYCFSYPEQHWDHECMKHFPHGYFFLNGRHAGTRYIPSIESDVLISEYDNQDDLDDVLDAMADDLDIDLAEIFNEEEH